MDYTRELLEAIGLQAARLRMVNMSSAMASQFAAAAAEFAAEIEQLGPSPLREHAPASSQALTESQPPSADPT